LFVFWGISINSDFVETHENEIITSKNTDIRLINLPK
jgi:hypothetical protein